jgi:hypothetical protein
MRIRASTAGSEAWQVADVRFGQGHMHGPKANVREKRLTRNGKISSPAARSRQRSALWYTNKREDWGVSDGGWNENSERIEKKGQRSKTKQICVLRVRTTGGDCKVSTGCCF